MTECEPREFYDSVIRVQRQPELDPPLTIRVESRPERFEPGARRAIRLAGVDGRDAPCWYLVDGQPSEYGRNLTHDDVRDWHISCGFEIAVTYRHAQHNPPPRMPIEQAAERGDMDVSSFKG